MEDKEPFKAQFEFSRRAITETAPHRAACRYDSADDNEDEELAASGEYFDLNMLPDQTPQDLYNQKSQQHTQRLNCPPSGKPLKPMGVGPNLPNKVFHSNCNTNYNSSKAKKNQNAQTNNRYSSQNMKSFEYEDDNEEDIDIADENFCQTKTDIMDQRRGSQRYKDRVKNMRVQSQETYMREGNMNTCADAEEEDDEFQMFDRAGPDHAQYALTEQNANPQQTENNALYQNADRWMTQPDRYQDEQSRTVNHKVSDKDEGAHFMYKELFQRLSDINKHEKPKGKNSTTKITKQKQYIQNQDTEQREPLKEMTQKLMSQQQMLKNTGKRQSQEQHKTIVSPDKTKRLSDKHKQSANNTHGNMIPHQKLTKMLVCNQENNFIDKKLKDHSKKHIAISKGIVNKSTSLHKSTDKTHSKGGQSDECSINNMKLKQPIETMKATQNALKPALNKGSQPMNINATINNILQNPILTNSSSTTGFGTGIKCPSSNFLKTATTAITSSLTKSSALLTQSSSNKQISQNRETPESSSRQKVRLTGTTLSSTSKRAAATTLSTNSQANTIQSSSTIPIAQHDSLTKRSQNSDSKQGKDIVSANPRSSSTIQKVDLQKMMIKNNSFLKQTSKGQGMGRQQNDFYHTIYKKISTIGSSNQTSGGKGQNQVKPMIGSSVKVKKISSKIQSQRLSGQGSCQASINSPGSKECAEFKSNLSSPSQSQTRKQKDNIQEQLRIQPHKQFEGHYTMDKNILNALLQFNQMQQQDKPDPVSISQRPQQQQQSILLQHQIKKSAPIGRPASGRLTRKVENPLNRKNSQESLFVNQIVDGPEYLQTQPVELSKHYNNQANIDADNRQSLTQQHKTQEKKINTLGTAGLKHADKIGKFLASKKEESQSMYGKQGFMNDAAKSRINLQKMQQLSTTLIQKTQ